MDRPSLLALPNDADTFAKVGAWCQADPTWIFAFAAAIATEGGTWPSEAATRAAQQAVASLATLPGEAVRAGLEPVIMGRDVDNALEWLKEIGAIALLFPELQATVDLTQESDRQHKDVWAHTKQVVKQSVRRPLVRWAALLHDIGKVPTRTFTAQGVHFHGHAHVGARMFDKISRRVIWDRDERHTIRFLVNNHLRTNSYTHDGWSDSAVRRFTREMGPYVPDLLDLSRADITSKRPGQRRPLGVREVELPHVAEVRDAEALADSTRQTPREPLDHARAVASALLAVLLDLDDLAPDEPVRLDRRRVDRARDVTARRLDDVDDTREERVLVARGRWLRRRDRLLARRLLHDANEPALRRAWCSSGAGRCSLMLW